LIKNNQFGNMNVGEIIWYDDKPFKVYLVTFCTQLVALK